MNPTSFIDMPPEPHNLGGLRVAEDEWDAINQIVESELRKLANAVLSAGPTIAVRFSHNSARAWKLFSYVTFISSSESIDPVVAGVIFSEGQTGTNIQGDIAGEESGDILFELPHANVVDHAKIASAARETAQKLASHSELVLAALINPDRKRPDY